MKPDVWDVLAVVGLALIGFGIAQWSIPAAMVAVGAILVAAGTLGAVRKGSE